jgi:hypothetical protein
MRPNTALEPTPTAPWARAEKCPRFRAWDGPRFEGDEEGNEHYSPYSEGNRPRFGRSPKARPFFSPLSFIA